MQSGPPPLVGFNNNVRYRGMRFHIQTEDSGVTKPHIITHLFADGGRVIKSLRTDYAEYGGAPMLGVDGVALVCHGRSNGRAIENAIRVAVKSARAGLGTETTAAMARNAFLWAPPAAAAPQAAGAPS